MINFVKIKTFISLVISIMALTAWVHAKEKEITKGNTQNPENLFSEAGRLYEEHKIIEAIEKLKQADKIAPNHTSTVANLACFLAEAKLYEQSTKYFEKLIQLEPNNSKAKVGYNVSKINSFLDKKNCKQADLFIKEITINKPDNSFINWNLARCYQDIQNYQKALKYWKKMVMIEPNNMHAKSKIIQIHQSTMDIASRNGAIDNILKAYKNTIDPESIKGNLFCREQYKTVLVLQCFNPNKNGCFYQRFNSEDGNQHFYRYSVADGQGY